MSQRMTTSAVVGVIGLVLWGAAGVAPGAEFRTSVRGKTIVRQADVSDAEAAPPASPTLGRTRCPTGRLFPLRLRPLLRICLNRLINPMVADPRADVIDCDWAGQL